MNIVRQMSKSRQINKAAPVLLSTTNIYSMAENRLTELKKVESTKIAALQKAPEGKIHVAKTKAFPQYYLRVDPKDKTGKYIPKREESKIKSYLQKAYDEKLLKLVKQEIKSIETFLRNSKDFNLKIQEIYSDNPVQVKSYITPIDCSNEDYISYWKNIPFTANPMPITTTEYETDAREIVRSKSEMNIANALRKAEIPYKYECPVTLYNGRIVYPDFTVLDVHNRKEIYWEHRGIMDDRDYTKNAVKKMKEYIRSGITTMDNLIITEENGYNPLGTDEINSIIDKIKNLGKI